MAFGTLVSLDDLQDVNELIADFGEDTLTERVNDAIAIHNASMQEALSDFCVITSRAMLPYGTGDEIEMQELDELGSPDVSKNTAAGNLGLPLRFYGGAVQWSRHFVLNSTVQQLLARLDAAAAADIRNIVRQIRRRLTDPTNNVAYVDRLDTGLTLELRALLNGDSRPIPIGPNGETFDGSTHNHFNGSATFTEAHLNALLDDVVEHGIDGGTVLYIARAQEAAIRGFTGSFDRYVSDGINPGANAQIATGRTLDVTNPTDRAIGTFSGAEVWVKPWVPANYQIAFDTGGGASKPLAIRTRGGSLAGDPYRGGFGTLYEDDLHPLRARALGREFGVGVAVRHKAAVGYSANATYTAPSF